MAISTYTELKAAISAWLVHDDISTQIDNFIALAEAQMNRELRVLAMQASQTGTLAAATLSAPTGLLEIISFNLDVAANKVLEYRPPEHFFHGNYDTAGEPKRFTLVGQTFHFSPDPTNAAGSYPYTLNYYERLPGVSATNATNWVLTNAPDLYLYGCLLHAAPFLQDDTQLARWRALYGDAVTALMGQDQRLRYRGGRQMARTTGIIMR